MARGNIRQRSKVRKNSWTVQVYLGVDPVTGKKRYRSESVKGPKSLAQRRLTAILREVDTGTFVKPSGMTVGEYLEHWLREYVEGHVRSRTVVSYRRIVARYLIPGVGGIPLERLSNRQIQEMESALLRSGGVGGKALSARTVSLVHRVLSGALKNALKDGIVVRNVAVGVMLPRAARYEAYTLGWNEVHRFLEGIDDPLYWTLVLLAIQTGLRRSELLGLYWRDIDLEAGTLAVQRGRVDGKTRVGEVVPPKSGRSRVVGLPEASVGALRAYRGPTVGGGSFVFCREDGSPVGPEEVTKRFRKMATAAGFERLRFHDLRHTHASLMLAEGIHLKVVAERLGHSNIGITGNLYSHVEPTVQREAVERFGDTWRRLEARKDTEWQKNGKSRAGGSSSRPNRI